MNIGEVLVRFGAETSGFMGGLRLIQAAMSGLGGFTKGALSDMNSGLHSITSGFATMGTGAGGVFSSMRLGAQDVGMGMLKLGAVMALVGGIAAVAIGVTLGVVAVRAAADFQQGLARLVTGAGDVTDNMKQMGQSILATSSATGVLTGQLLPAMYQIISAGQRGAQAQDTLRVAAMGSVVEQAKIVDVAKAITTAMTDYGTAEFNATQFMNGYTRATQLGKLTLEELSTSMGPILPLAKNIGISFADVAGAMSTMTNAGIPAERAATSLRFLFQSLENPTHKATTAMTEYGLSSIAVGNELKKSLPGALEMIYQAARKAGPEGSVPFNRAVSDMIGGQRSLQAYLSLTGSHFATYSSNVKAIAAAMNGSKTAVLGWDVAQQNLNLQIDRVKASVMALAINVGTQLLPIITRIASQIAPVIANFAEWATKSNFLGNAIAAVAPIFNAFFGTLAAVLPTVIGAFLQFMAVLGRLIASIAGNKQGMEALILIAKGLALVIAGVLIAGLLTLAIVFGAIALVIVGVIGIVIALIAVWNMLVAAAHWVAGAWNSAIALLVGLWHTLVAAAVTVFNAVKNAIVSAFNATIAWIGGAWHSAIAFIVGIWHTLAGAATLAFNAVKTAIINATNAVIGWLGGAWHTAVNAVVSAFRWLYEHNYYYQWLVDIIRTVVTGVVNFLKAIWPGVVAFVVGQWNWLKDQATAIFNIIKDGIMAAVNWTINWLTTAWANSVKWIGEKWNLLKGLAKSAWDAVTGVFNAVWGIISGILNSLWASISGWWTGTVQPQMKQGADTAWKGVSDTFNSAWGTYVSGPLTSLSGSIGGWIGDQANQLYQAGMNFMQMLANGITAGAGWVLDAAKTVAGGIWSVLGFHSPPATGPAADADKWMPNMVNMLTKGMTAGVPSVSKAATQLAQPIQGNLSASGTHSPSSASNDRRPVIIQVGTQEYRGFVENLGRDLSSKIILQRGGMR